jgi:hypothetical protein
MEESGSGRGREAAALKKPLFYGLEATGETAGGRAAAALLT